MQVSIIFKNKCLNSCPYSNWVFYFDDVRGGFRWSLQQGKKPIEVCKHAIGGVLGDGVDRKGRKPCVIGFYHFQIFTHQQSLYFGENYENMKEKLTGYWSDNVKIR